MSKQTFGTFMFDDFSLSSFSGQQRETIGVVSLRIRNAAVIRRLGQRGWADDDHMRPRAFQFFFSLYSRLTRRFTFNLEFFLLSLINTFYTRCLSNSISSLFSKTLSFTSIVNEKMWLVAG